MKLIEFQSKTSVTISIRSTEGFDNYSENFKTLRETLIQGAVLMVGYVTNMCKDRIYFIKTKKVLSDSKLIALF